MCVDRSLLRIAKKPRRFLAERWCHFCSEWRQTLSFLIWCAEHLALAIILPATGSVGSLTPYLSIICIVRSTVTLLMMLDMIDGIGG